MSDNVQSCYYTTSDNLRCHYLLWPNHASQSCCLLMHGFSNDAHIWDALARKLQHRHNVIAQDFRGHGDSDWDRLAHYTHQQLCLDTVALIKQHGEFSQWHIIGHSLGARVAMLMLDDNNIKASSFTIIDTGPEVRSAGVNKVRQDAQNFPSSFASQQAYYDFLCNIYLFAETERLQELARWGLKKDAAGRWISKTDPAFTDALWKPADELAQQNNHHGLRYPMQEQLWQALGKLDCPTLIIRGQASAILSRDVAERMNRIIADARLIVIDRAGHAVPVDNPQAFEDAVCAFITDESSD